MKTWTLCFGPIVAIVVGLILNSLQFESAIAWTAAITLLVAIWWIFEPIPIPATSLIPIALFPVVGVLTPQQVAAAYGHKLVLLMLGGFMLSAAMERCGAHRRIALGMVSLFGGSSGRRLVFGFMAASAFLSMWISNAATTLMLLPIAMAVVSQTQNRRLAVSLLLGIAYAASIGGVGTPIGTPPNLVFMNEFEQSTGESITFFGWMKLSMPAVIVMFPIAGWWLTRGLSDIDEIKLPDVGSWRSEEVRTLFVFVITALLWMFRQQPFGGWQGLAASLGLPLTHANDASVALVGALMLFLIPRGGSTDSVGSNAVSESNQSEDSEKLVSTPSSAMLLDWKTAQTIPWGILILFAGGICIASAFKSSGLSEQLGGLVAGLGELPTILLIASICLTVTFLTEVTSNTATTQLLLPILATAAIAAAIDPKVFMVPATISASFAFMLPVATPPNAIVFGSQKITIRDMVREGIVLNLIGVVIVSALCYLQFR